MKALRVLRDCWINLLLSVLFILILAATSPKQATAEVSKSLDTISTTRYVAPTGNDVGTCTSPESPCRTIQYAVNQSISGDTILVAAGRYTYDQRVDNCSFLLTRAIVCLLDKQLRIYGGFSTSNWTSPNTNNNVTIIDGENTYRGVAVVGYRTRTAHLEMRGLIITNGLAQGPTYLSPYEPGGMGGGMLVQNASIYLEDLTFTNNTAKGADTLSGDGGGADGSAIRIESTPLDRTSIIKGVRFDNNHSIAGSGPDRGGVAFGALFIYNSNVTIEDSIFVDNSAYGGSTTGTGISKRDGLKADALGGAIGIERGNIITIRNVEIRNNKAVGGNGATYGGGAYGGGILVEDTNWFSLYDSIVSNNIAQAGDGIVAGNPGGGGIQSQNNKELMIEKTMIVSNASIGGDTTADNSPGGPGAGGGLYIFSTRKDTPYHATLKNVIIANNLAQQGNGVQGLGNGGGGGFVIQGVTADISHATIAGNRLDPTQIVGQAFIVSPWKLSNGDIPTTVNLSNSIVADHKEGGTNAVAIAVAQGGSLNLDQVMFAGNKKDTNVDNIPFQAGIYSGVTTCFSTNSANFVFPGGPYYNYRIRANSTAKDRGNINSATEDFEGQLRPFDNGVDLGADEYWPFILNGHVGNRFIQLNWESSAQILQGAVEYYKINLICESGASSPKEIPCGQSTIIGNVTNLTLSGLSNFKNYTFQVFAYDASGNLLANSLTLTLSPSDILLYLPVVVK